MVPYAIIVQLQASLCTGDGLCFTRERRSEAILKIVNYRVAVDVFRHGTGNDVFTGFAGSGSKGYRPVVRWPGHFPLQNTAVIFASWQSYVITCWYPKKVGRGHPGFFSSPTRLILTKTDSQSVLSSGTSQLMYSLDTATRTPPYGWPDLSVL